MIEIYCTPTLSETDFLAIEKRLLSGLTEKQLQAVQLYKKPISRQHSLLGTLLAKKVIARKLSIPSKDIEFIKEKNGKPFYTNSDDIHFNISHAGRWVVVALAPLAVGIDIEKLRIPQYRIAERFFSKEEQKDLFSLPEPARQNYFFDLWTLKESYLKLLGKGLTRSLNTFTIQKLEGKFHLIEDRNIRSDIHLLSFKFDKKYTLSVSSYCKEFDGRIRSITFDEL